LTRSHLTRRGRSTKRAGDLTKFIDDEFGGDFTPLPTLHDPDARDPSTIGLYPATLPIEVALHETPLPELKAEYGFTDEEWSALPHNPQFIATSKQPRTCSSGGHVVPREGSVAG
jgi:hypothetical protein